jgi:hypothetical protein
LEPLQAQLLENPVVVADRPAPFLVVVALVLGCRRTPRTSGKFVFSDHEVPHREQSGLTRQSRLRYGESPPTSIELIYPTDETAEARLHTDELDFWRALLCVRHDIGTPWTALRVGRNRRRSPSLMRLMRIASPRPFGGSEALSDRAGASQVRAKFVDRRKTLRAKDNSRQPLGCSERLSSL